MTSEVIFDIDQIQTDVEKLEKAATAPDFWDNQIKAQETFKKTRRLKDDI